MRWLRAVAWRYKETERGQASANGAKRANHRPPAGVDLSKQIRLTDKTLSALAFIICGGSQSSNKELLGPYRSGPEILAFFNRLTGSDDKYQDGFGSRMPETISRLEAINKTPLMTSAIEAAVHPADYIDCGKDVTKAVEHLNQYLQHDGFELQKIGLIYRLVEIAGTSVGVRVSSSLDSDYIREQIDKAEQKIALGDYDGAITNARTLLEGVILEIERFITGKEPVQDGDLPKYYKRTQKLMNLDPAQIAKDGKPIPESLAMVLRGLSSIVQGIAEARNKASDAHARSFKPDKRHAELVVNGSKTVADYLIATFEHQKAKGAFTSSSQAGSEEQKEHGRK